MENITAQSIDKKAILIAIGNVFEKTYECKLDYKVFEEISDDLKILSLYFKTSLVESFFLSIIYVANPLRTFLYNNGLL